MLVPASEILLPDASPPRQTDLEEIALEVSTAAPLLVAPRLDRHGATDRPPFALIDGARRYLSVIYTTPPTARPYFAFRCEVVEGMWAIRCPGMKLPTVNDWRGCHWSKANKLKQQLRTRIEVALARCDPRPPRAILPRTVGLRLDTRRGRACDPDNAWKLLLDVLGLLGLIVDDDEHWCRTEWHPSRRADDDGFTITLADRPIDTVQPGG